MKIQINTETKTIKVEEAVNFEKLYAFISSLPEHTFGKWQEYKIDCNTKIEIVYDYHPVYWNRPYWYYGSSTVSGVTTASGAYDSSTASTYVNHDNKALANNSLHSFEINN